MKSANAFSACCRKGNEISSCGHESQIAECGSHSAGMWKPNSLGVGIEGFKTVRKADKCRDGDFGESPSLRGCADCGKGRALQSELLPRRRRASRLFQNCHRQTTAPKI